MLAPAIAEELRKPGADAVAVSERAELWQSTDAVLLEWATTESRVFVTDNVKDFRMLERSWLAQGRLHSGLVYINSKAYPMSRGRTGAIAAALLERHRASAWPGPGMSDWL
jgi:hypothetical protein